MENYVNMVTMKATSNIKLLQSSVYKEEKEIDTSKWKTYPITQLFTVKPGSRLRKQDMIPGNINYVWVYAFNNGVTAKIGNTENIHPAGTITVCYNGSIGQAFYQESPFWATDDVKVLYPKFSLNLNIA